MKSNNRRMFLKYAGMAGIGAIVTNSSKAFSIPSGRGPILADSPSGSLFWPKDMNQGNLSIIGLYGNWASALTEKNLPSRSFRKKEYKDIDVWRKDAKMCLTERMGIPDIGGMPEVTVKRKYIYDGLIIQELSWQLPYGRPTEAILLKPSNARKPLPGILAFYDHGGNKYFGTRKITKTSEDQHSLIVEHQNHYYSGRAWANEIAKKGYVVLVSDAFAFASRRVLLQDVPEKLREGLSDENPEDSKNIALYNHWASNHEEVMAKSLFCAVTTWTGVFFAEDRKALDILCARKDVDSSRIGCGGLSGGGLRSVLLGGLDPRIKCAVCVGFMTTWNDFLLNKSYTHTWMTYVPLLPNELNFPENLGLRVPLPTMALNNSEDSIFTLSQINAANNIQKEVFEKANAADRYKCSF